MKNKTVSGISITKMTSGILTTKIVIINLVLWAIFWLAVGSILWLTIAEEYHKYLFIGIGVIFLFLILKTVAGIIAVRIVALNKVINNFDKR